MKRRGTARKLGASRALALPADVTNPAQMRSLANMAVERFGGICVWVNMAGLSRWGPSEAIPAEAQAQLVQVKLIGEMNGCHAALPYMLRRDQGVIVKVSSIGGRVPIPIAAACSASKYGVAGSTEALRDELATRSGIAVSGVYPGYVDTPTDIHSVNHSGRSFRLVLPVLAPEKVAGGRRLSAASPPRPASWPAARLGAALRFGARRRRSGSRARSGSGSCCDPGHRPRPPTARQRRPWRRDQSFVGVGGEAAERKRPTRLARIAHGCAGWLSRPGLGGDRTSLDRRQPPIGNFGE